MKKNVLLIIALFIASLNLRPAINSIAPLLESIRSDLGMSAAVASLLTAIPVLCMGIFSPVAVKAGGKWGIERIIGLSLVIIGIGTVIRLFTNSVLFLVTTAFIAGIGIALIGPLLSGFIKQHFPNHVPSMVAVYTVALTLGAAFSSALSTTLENSFNSWQISLAFWAIIAFVAAVIWWLFVNQQVKKSAYTATAGTKVQLPWGNGKAWILTLSFGLMAMLFYSITAWLPQIIEGMGYTKNYATIALTIFVAVQIPVSLVLPILLKRFPSRRLWLVVESILELVGLILLVLNVEPLVASALIGIGAGGLFSLNLLLPIDATDNAHEAASWSAMIQSAGYVIGALGPIILGWIHDATNSFVSAVFGMIVIVLIMSIFQFTATAKRRVNTFKEKAQDSGGKQSIV
ncbi:MFS transporter [Neobacillus thermocopriae]|uniref:MFS transporter n=1 Tax=Neobacillus thermocopriae TaxID=1215031 RepID=UPI002E24832F|nr:MFS transporter [Neobacillus thermocopriae]MED3622948.1 MFS transporter [Neobacillus thermocopriae]MED3713222.1 MFS transporter [Neobacillus thermocopriae]